MSIREQLIETHGKQEEKRSILGFLIEKYGLPDEQERKLFDNVTIITFPIMDDDIEPETDIQKEIDTEIENSINNENEKEL